MTKPVSVRLWRHALYEAYGNIPGSRKFDGDCEPIHDVEVLLNGAILKLHRSILIHATPYFADAILASKPNEMLRIDCSDGCDDSRYIQALIEAAYCGSKEFDVFQASEIVGLARECAKHRTSMPARLVCVYPVFRLDARPTAPGSVGTRQRQYAAKDDPKEMRALIDVINASLYIQLIDTIDWEWRHVGPWFCKAIDGLRHPIWNYHFE
ncbi:uncharacterized protein ACA1_079220 [Acanthamoeba castellanii str. Neff]|uniref:BTB domain-containing protein n=1 Tax=Acanthamoeba castellanii (strain ATCC 30010 / Neff) TaxID=1257118 RepID=L8GUQ0_ACACF|nr:uncharacterized protein ACA1_079220 [Acanthamoeba castellanii str. Neff]ELR15826.1 hypothetical protein ACA1_079220 [Acanthamoeba castellanii str. Neff]